MNMEVEESRKRKLFNALCHGTISPVHHISEVTQEQDNIKITQQKDTGDLKLRELLSSKRVKYDIPDSDKAVEFRNVAYTSKSTEVEENFVSGKQNNKQIAESNSSCVSGIKNYHSDLTENENVHGNDNFTKSEQTSESSSSLRSNLKNHQCISDGNEYVHDKFTISGACNPCQSFSTQMEQSSSESQDFHSNVSVPNGVDRSGMKKKEYSLNGKIPLAYDTNISLLKLAHKLKIAQDKLQNKTTNKALETLDNLKSSRVLQETTSCNTLSSTKHQNGDLTKTEQFLYNKDKSLPDMKSKVVKCVTEIKPIKLPKLPKPAIDVLTSLKIDDESQKEEIPPSCSSIPLWPILGASREGATRMDTSFLNKYISEPHICNSDVSTTTRSGRQVVVSMKALQNFKKEPLETVDEFPTIPEPLMEQECKTVEKIAVSSILMANLPKIAKKAYDITKLTLDASRRAVLLSVGQKAKPDAKSYDMTYKQTIQSSFKSGKESNVLNINKVSNMSSNSGLLTSSPYTVSLLKSSTSKPCDESASLEAVDLSIHNASTTGKTMLQIKDVNTENNTVEFFSGENIANISNSIVDPGIVPKTSDKKEIIDEQRVKSEINSNTYVMNKSSIPRKYQCMQCNYQTDNRSHLRRHESSVHSGDKMYCCYVCKKEFARSEKCRAHIMKQHPGVGYDARFIRKDKFQSRQISSSPLKCSPVSDKKEDSLSRSTTPVNAKEGTETIFDQSGLSASSDIKETSSLDGSEFPEGQTISPPEELPLNLSSDVIAVSQKISVQDSPNKMYRCQICFYVGRDAWHLKRHISDVHNNKKAFKCKVCNYVTSRKHRLISHMKGHGELFCMHCEYSTTVYEDFQVHLKNCSLQQKAGSLTCGYCNQSFFNRKILADHMLRFHNLELYCCDLCYFTTTDSDEFEIHEQQHFKVDCSATCNKCKVSFDTEKQCEEHILHFHGGEEDSYSINDACVDKTDENHYKCVLCGYQTEHVAVIKNHLEMHTRNMYKCEVLNCLFSAASKKSMKHHVISEHPDFKQERKSPERKVNKPVIPKVVQATSSTEEGIYDQDTGGLIGHGSGSWRCAFCPTKPPFRYRRSYEKHVTKHFSNMSNNIATAVGNVLGDIGENRSLPFPENCPICEQEFLARSELRHHLQTVHETDIVEVSNDNLDKDETGDLWGEGLSQTQRWVNEQKFEVPVGRDNIEGDENNDSVTPEEWTNDNSKRISDDEDIINDI